MTETVLTLEAIRALAVRALAANGADAENAGAVADTVTRAERDGSRSHGLFRIPGYVASLASGKVNGAARARAPAEGCPVNADLVRRIEELASRTGGGGGAS